MSTAQNVILVHGLWYGKRSMMFMAGRLRDAGFSTHLFAYHATSEDLATNAEHLAKFCRQVSDAETHFVAHSYGGLVVAQMMSSLSVPNTGRAVFLGSPLQGSQTVRGALRLPGLQGLFGKAANALSEGVSSWGKGNSVAMIAGSKALGLGRLFALGGSQGDGSIELAETESADLQCRMVMPVTHSGMIYSSKVAEQVIHYLKHGEMSFRTRQEKHPIRDKIPG